MRTWRRHGFAVVPLVAAGLLIPASLQSQEQSEGRVVDCQIPDSPHLVGQVRDRATGFPLEQALVYSRNLACGALTDADGRFVLRRFGFTAVVVEAIGYERIEFELEGAKDTLRVDVEMESAAGPRHEVVEDFTRLAGKPLALPNPVGVAGCYWMGGGPWAEETLELRAEGRVTPEFQPGYRGHWVLEESGEAIRISRMFTPDAGEGARLALGTDPDWGHLELRINSYRMFDSTETLTFAVRVPCS